MSTKRTRSSSTKRQSLRSGSPSKPKDEHWTQLSCGCLLIGNDGSKVTCREHTSPKLKKALAKSKVVRPLSIRKLEDRTNALLRQQKHTEEQIAEITARLAILRENVNRLMNPNPFWGH